MGYPLIFQIQLMNKVLFYLFFYFVAPLNTIVAEAVAARSWRFTHSQVELGNGIFL